MYFSGFCLDNESELFKEYIEDGDFVVSGFSYGAIKAFKYTLESLKNGNRIDKLQLFSPAYFLEETTKFKRLQLMFFKKDENEYKNNFIKNTIYPKDIDMKKYIIDGSYAELDELLNYQWDKNDLEYIIDKNVKLEVFLGSKDKIVSSEKSKEFFRNYGEVYFIKDLGHIL